MDNKMPASMRCTQLTGLCLLIAASFLSAGAYAQTSSQDAVAASDKTIVLEEIIVTARHREENLQNSPVSVTAFSEEYLQQTRARTLEDFAVSVPGMSFVGNNSPENIIVVRGVSTGVVSRDEGSVAGLYIGDVPVNSNRYNPDLRLYDIERIEVLRGPQGTLFGEGSIGGTLRLVPNKPNLSEWEASIEGALSNTRQGDGSYEVAVVANAPVIADKLSIRAVAYQVGEAGFVDNVTLDQDNVNETDTIGGRISVAFAPRDDLLVTAMVLHQDSEADGRAQYDPDLGDLKQARNFQEALDDDFTLVNFTANWDLGAASIDASSAYLDRSVVNLRDISPLIGGLPLFLDDLTTFKYYIQEIRLTSNTGLFNDRLDWQAGLFYSKGKEFYTQDAQSEALGGDVLDSDNSLNRKQIALFGEVDLALTERLTFTTGLRWFDIEQDGVNINGGLLAGLDAGVITVEETDIAESGVTPKFRLSRDLSADALLFAVASRGFRQGGPTGQGVSPDPETGAPAPTQFDSDKVWNYELGFKSSWLDNRLSVNGAAFYIDFTDIQSTIIRSDGHTFTVNADQARSSGVELELRALAAAGLEVFMTASWVNSELTGDQLPPGDGRDGDRIPGVPDITFSAGVHYQWPISGELAGFANFNMQYVGDSFNGFSSAAGTRGGVVADRQTPYQIGNLRMGVQNKKWELSIYAENLWDERAVLFFNRIIGDVRINTTRPRTLGIAFKTRL